jgi:hypothetical protein
MRLSALIIVPSIALALAANACITVATPTGEPLPAADAGSTTKDAGATGDAAARGGGDGDGGVGVGDVCTASCAQVDAPRCPGADPNCVSDCQKLLAGAPAACQSAARALYACQAANTFSCDANGKPHAAACDGPEQSLILCLQGGGGDAGTPSTCPSAQGDNACTACAKASCCTAYAACGNSNDCIALSQCISTCQDQTCVSNCASRYPGGVSALEALEQCAGSACSQPCGGK